MSIEDMRETIKHVYSSESWKERVTKMSDEQVTAIYLKFKEEGKIRDHKWGESYRKYWDELCRRCAEK